MCVFPLVNWHIRQRVISTLESNSCNCVLKVNALLEKQMKGVCLKQQMLHGCDGTRFMLIMEVV